jgi:hypothetical protein
MSHAQYKLPNSTFDPDMLNELFANMTLKSEVKLIEMSFYVFLSK